MGCSCCTAWCMCWHTVFGIWKRAVCLLLLKHCVNSAFLSEKLTFECKIFKSQFYSCCLTTATQVNGFQSTLTTWKNGNRGAGEEKKLSAQRVHMSCIFQWYLGLYPLCFAGLEFYNDPFNMILIHYHEKRKCKSFNSPLCKEGSHSLLSGHVKSKCAPYSRCGFINLLNVQFEIVTLKNE